MGPIEGDWRKKNKLKASSNGTYSDWSDELFAKIVDWRLYLDVCLCVYAIDSDILLISKPKGSCAQLLVFRCGLVCCYSLLILRWFLSWCVYTLPVWWTVKVRKNERETELGWWKKGKRPITCLWLSSVWLVLSVEKWRFNDKRNFPFATPFTLNFFSILFLLSFLRFIYSHDWI